MDRAQDNLQRVVVFRLANDWFGIPVNLVREIVPTPRITPVPFTMPSLRGIAAVRGEIVSMLDLRSILQIESNAETPSRVVIVHADAMDAGFLADSVTDVVGVTMLDAASVVSMHASPFITAMALWERKEVALLAVADLLRHVRPPQSHAGTEGAQ